MSLTNLKVGARLGLGFGAVVTLMLIITVLSVTSFRGLDVQFRYILEDDVTKLIEANNMLDGANVIAIEMRNTLLIEQRSEQLKSLDRILEQSQIIKSNLDQLDEQVKTVEEGRVFKLDSGNGRTQKFETSPLTTATDGSTTKNKAKPVVLAMERSNRVRFQQLAIAKE